MGVYKEMLIKQLVFDCYRKGSVLMIVHGYSLFGTACELCRQVELCEG